MKQQLTYLALGDSYTIGESVLLWQNFPSCIVRQLRGWKNQINAPEILAKTGWTTDELSTSISKYQFNEGGYVFVTLLIGVNNQYRGYPITQYEIEYEKLLNFALTQSKQVIVLSIPDYGYSKFGTDKGIDKEKCSKEIDQYNNICEKITRKYNCSWLNITDLTRTSDENMYAPDYLHYSEKMHDLWASLVVQVIQDAIKKQI